MCIYMCRYKYIYIYIYINTLYACMLSWVMYRYIHMYVYIYTYVHILICTYGVSHVGRKPKLPGGAEAMAPGLRERAGPAQCAARLKQEFI